MRVGPCIRGIALRSAAVSARVDGDRPLAAAALQVVSIIWSPPGPILIIQCGNRKADAAPTNVLSALPGLGRSHQGQVRQL